MPTFIEELVYKICHASKMCLVHMDYDATACYHRNVMSLTSLISQAYGHCWSIILLNVQTLREVKYLLNWAYLKTHIHTAKHSLYMGPVKVLGTHLPYGVFSVLFYLIYMKKELMGQCSSHLMV